MRVKIDNLRNKPWLDLPEEDVRDVLLPKGFIGEEERRSYHYLARHFACGNLPIVDAGACLGSSAYCFASGLRKNPNRNWGTIHSYDKFLVGEDYVADLISKSFRPSRGGDDFFDIFEFQVGRYKEFIKPHRGNFLVETWDYGDIDILFVDLAKSVDLHNKIVEIFYTSLVPQQSLVMHQDFYHCWNPWMHQGMQYLVNKFEVVDEFIPSNSRLFFAKGEITNDDVEAIKSLSAEKRLELMDAFIEREKGDQRAMARVSKMCQLWHDQNANEFDDERNRLIAEFGWRTDTAWGYQANQLYNHMQSGVAA